MKKIRFLRTFASEHSINMKNIKKVCTGVFATMCCIALFSSCHKNESNGSEETVYDNSPVPIRLSAGEPSYVTTKAGLDAWDNSELFVFGLKRTPGSVVGSGVYNFDDVANVVDVKVSGVSGKSAGLDLKTENGAPYFYSEKEIYDFYGYHLGGAVVSDKKISKDSYSYTVTFDGSNDLMCAKTNRQKDLEKSDRTDVSEEEIYSAWAARRGIHPTLIFDHLLTRLNFIIKGKGTNYGDVIVTGIDVMGVNSGVLTVVGNDLGFVPDAAAEPVSLSLKTAQDEEFSGEVVEENRSNLPLGGKGACIMIAPGVEEIEVAIHMKERLSGKLLEDYKFTAKASQILKKDEDGNIVSVHHFEAGNSYDFFITLYGPSEIVISAYLNNWEPGGDFDVDPDRRDPASGFIPDDETIHVTGITLDRSSVSLTEGDKVTLSATVNPSDATDKTVIWSSDNTSVVTVMDGVLTAAGVGTATITAATSNGKKATCSVLVRAREGMDMDAEEGYL